MQDPIKLLSRFKTLDSFRPLTQPLPTRAREADERSTVGGSELCLKYTAAEGSSSAGSLAEGQPSGTSGPNQWGQVQTPNTAVKGLHNSAIQRSRGASIPTTLPKDSKSQGFPMRTLYGSPFPRSAPATLSPSQNPRPPQRPSSLPTPTLHAQVQPQPAQACAPTSASSPSR